MSANETLKTSINVSGYTLVEWLRAANINVNLADNKDVTAWRNNVSPVEYKPESHKIKLSHGR